MNLQRFESARRLQIQDGKSELNPVGSAEPLFRVNQ
jgi:hypothetical protein